MQWSGRENAGFSSAQPWFAVNENYKRINAESEEADPLSILNFYRRCLHLRKTTDALLWGDYREYQHWRRRVYLYERRYRGERILVVCSFSEKEKSWRLPRGYSRIGAELLLCNYPDGAKPERLRPYETQVWRWSTAAPQRDEQPPRNDRAG